MGIGGKFAFRNKLISKPNSASIVNSWTECLLHKLSSLFIYDESTGELAKISYMHKSSSLVLGTKQFSHNRISTAIFT